MSEIELNEGDIYSWRWRDESLGYHCYSRIAVATGGRLLDTFWSGGVRKRIAPETVVLTLLGNLNDLIEISKYEIPYFRAEDIVDMRHSNNTSAPVYLRKGAKRDAATMLEYAQGKLHEATSDLEAARHAASRYSAIIEQIEEGNLHEVRF